MTRFTSIATAVAASLALTSSAYAQGQADLASKLNDEGKELMFAQRFAEASWVGMLPVGARDPKLVTGPGVVWEVAPLGATGRLALAVFVESARATGTGVHSISYTDASGARRTVKP